MARRSCRRALWACLLSRGAAARLALRLEWRWGTCGSILDEHLGALEIETEAHFLQTGLAHGAAEAHLVVRVKHQKATAARADQLAAKRAILARQFIPAVDFAVAHTRRTLFLVFPVDIHQLGKACQVSAFQR